MLQKIKNIYHLFQAVLANIIYGFPSKKLTVIGVTGTDGKTTTVNLIYHILETAGKNVSMISTVGAIINNKKFDIGFHVTTPSSFALQKFLRDSIRMKDPSTSPSASSGSAQDDDEKKYLILEVTSHALDQNRVWGINFAISVLTNITHEHLDYHKTYENLLKTKLKLLMRSKIAIVNRDDKSYRQFPISNFQFLNKKVVTYGLSKDADVNPKNFSFKSNLLGDFNIHNILAAMSVCKQLGLSDADIKKGISSFKAPIGRQEIVYDEDFVVMIDFAHTSNSFAQLLPEIKKQTGKRLIHVFGAAGKRDYAKRPLMGKWSSKFADIIILTAEDPRGESVEKINNEIENGIKNYELRIKDKTLFEIPDRKEAIEFAINLAQEGDTVLLTGKSHEKSMNYGKGEIPWDEFEVAKDAIKNKLCHSE